MQGGYALIYSAEILHTPCKQRQGMRQVDPVQSWRILKEKNYGIRLDCCNLAESHFGTRKFREQILAVDEFPELAIAV